MNGIGLNDREELYQTVYRLLDRFWCEGHCYNEEGELAGPLCCIRVAEKLDNGLVRDVFGNVYTEDGRRCGENGYEYFYESTMGNVHRISYTAGAEKNGGEIREMIFRDRYLKKLIAILRKGGNYASDKPVLKEISDTYLEELIIFVWHMFYTAAEDLVDLRAKTVAVERWHHKEADMAWDMRAYAKTLEDVETDPQLVKLKERYVRTAETKVPGEDDDLLDLPFDAEDDNVFDFMEDFSWEEEDKERLDRKLRDFGKSARTRIEEELKKNYSKYNLDQKNLERLAGFLFFHLQSRGMEGYCKSSDTYYNLLIESVDVDQMMEFLNELIMNTMSNFIGIASKGRVIIDEADLLQKEEREDAFLRRIDEWLEHANSVLVVNTIEEPVVDMDAPTGGIQGEMQRKKKKHQLLWLALKKFMSKEGNKPVIVISSKEVYDHRFRQDKELYYRYLGHHIHIERWSEEQIFTLLVEELRQKEIRISDEFLEKLRGYFFTVYRRADLKGLKFNRDLINRLYANFFSKGEERWEFTEDCIPHYRKTPITEESILAQLDDLVGLDAVKDQLHKLYQSYRNIPENKKKPLHMVFMGNPGTGKTTVAQRMADLYFSMGMIETNRLVTVSANELISGWKGVTAGKTIDKIKSAYGGVLFIDEAYALKDSEKGEEVIPVLLKEATESVDRLVIILAGYEEEMRSFLKMNRGLASRFERHILFPDYSVEELVQVFINKCRAGGFVLAEDCMETLTRCIESAKTQQNFGNARYIETLYHRVTENWATDESRTESAGSLSESGMRVIEAKHFGNLIPSEEDDTLEDMIGLDVVKKEVMKFAQQVSFQKYLSQKGNKKLPPMNMHMIFTGNPGTGKTTVAGHIANTLYQSGVLKTNRILKLERKDLVGKYIGSTENKTDEVLRSGYGGVIFIDEAYSLTVSEDDSRDYASRVVEVLLTAMEAHKEDTVFIFAGYSEEMQRFIDSNPGIQSRIGYVIHFPDYSAEELTEIYMRRMKEIGFNTRDGVKSKILNIMEYFRADKNFGNGRFVERVVQQTIIKRSGRDYQKKYLDILVKDVPEINELIETSARADQMHDPAGLSEESFYRTAVHELGHAVISVVKGRVPENISTRSQVGSYGHVIIKRGHGAWTENDYMGQLAILLGGRKAEQVILGAATDGCSSDFEKAKNCAERMVNNFAMGKLYQTEPKDFILKADDEAESIIVKYRRFIERMAKILVKQEAMSGKELQRELQKFDRPKKNTAEKKTKK